MSATALTPLSPLLVHPVDGYDVVNCPSLLHWRHAGARKTKNGAGRGRAVDQSVGQLLAHSVAGSASNQGGSNGPARRPAGGLIDWMRCASGRPDGRCLFSIGVTVQQTAWEAHNFGELSAKSLFTMSTSATQASSG